MSIRTSPRRATDGNITAIRRWPIAATGLLVLAVIYTLYFAAGLLIPIAFAIFLNVALSPLVMVLNRIGIPQTLASIGIIIALLGIVFGALFVFAEPAEEWLSEAPRSVRELKADMISAKGRFSDIQELAEEVEELTDVSGDETPQVTLQRPGLIEYVLIDLPLMFASTGVTLILTFFLLCAGQDFLRRLTRMGRTWNERRRIVTIVRRIEKDLSRYLRTITVINIFLGITVTVLMWLMGVSNPALWGAMVGVLNFAPYIGALMSTGVLAIVGLGEFGTGLHGLMVPGAFIALTILEGQILTPAILGRRMALSPVSVFLSVMIWGWLWGVAGALIAVPMAVSLKVIFDQLPRLQPASALVFGGPLPPAPPPQY